MKDEVKGNAHWILRFAIQFSIQSVKNLFEFVGSIKLPVGNDMFKINNKGNVLKHLFLLRICIPKSFKY